MTAYSQAQRFLSVETPLGKDLLLLERMTGHEGISSPFSFQLELLAEANAEVPFEKLLGQPLTVRLQRRTGRERIFSGICARLRQGGAAGGASPDPLFLRYRAELVPRFWLWTKRVQSRIFQQQTVPDILKIVLQGLDVSYCQVSAAYQPRNYCVQYRESDFAFASRLMEEEGIFYYFEHSPQGEKLVLVDHASSLPTLPTPDDHVVFEQASSPIHREAITNWEKAQEVAASGHVVRDHSFELPQSTLEAESSANGSVAVGPAQHPLRMACNQGLFVYEHLGEYANRFDGVGPGGDERPAEVQKIFQENQRTAQLRMEEESARSLRVEGAGTCAGLLPGSRFHLLQHAQGKGEYLVLRVEHVAEQEGVFRSGASAPPRYQNRFTCLPASMAFRPPRTTPRPRVDGTVTATVSGHEPGAIFTDKYGRVKVLFHWDRAGKIDGASSCWIRVMQPWAGQGWGGVQLPRVGQEVVVDFLEGNPDRPIILGGVYNAEQMPAYPLPEQCETSGVRSRTHKSADAEKYNEVRMVDTPDQELLHVQAQKDMATAVKHDHDLKVDHDSTVKVKHNATTTVGDGPLTMNLVTTWNHIELDKLTKTVVVGAVHSEAQAVKLEIAPLRFVGVVGAQVHVVGPLMVEAIVGQKRQSVMGKKTEVVIGTMSETVIGTKSEMVKGIKSETVTGNKSETVTGNAEETVKGNCIQKVSSDFEQSVDGNRQVVVKGNVLELAHGSHHIIFTKKFKVGILDEINIKIEKQVVTLACGSSKLRIGKDQIVMTGQSIKLVAQDRVSIEAPSFSVSNPGGTVPESPEREVVVMPDKTTNVGGKQYQPPVMTDEEALEIMKRMRALAVKIQ